MCFLLYLLIIPIFLIIGGVTFSLAEKEASQEAARISAMYCVPERKKFMRELKASLKKNFSTTTKAHSFRHIWRLIRVTVIKVENCHRQKLFQLLPIDPFVFKNGILYSYGVYTTIGYGNLFPRTVKGRLLTVVYAVVGIPLNIAFMADLGELMARAVQRCLKYFRLHVMKKKTGDLCIEYKKFALVAIISILFTPVLAVIVMRAEHARKWNYIDSLYYTFITSTLIGLGDLAPYPSYVQFFVLMPLFFVAETIFALMFGFITHLYRYESVILYKLIKHKITRMLLHRRIENMRSVRLAQSARQQLLKQEESEGATTASAVANAQANIAQVDAQIAQLSAREMKIQKKIDNEVEMLEAVPSQINLGVLNANIKSEGTAQTKLRNKLKSWLRRYQNPKDEDAN